MFSCPRSQAGKAALCLAVFQVNGSTGRMHLHGYSTAVHASPDPVLLRFPVEVHQFGIHAVAAQVEVKAKAGRHHCGNASTARPKLEVLVEGCEVGADPSSAGARFDASPDVADVYTSP